MKHNRTHKNFGAVSKGETHVIGIPQGDKRSEQKKYLK